MEREGRLEFTDQDFDFIRTMVKKQTGIALSDHKRELVYGRLSKRLRGLGLNTFADYCRIVEAQTETEIGELINAITTNLTSFFRENHHFEYLTETLIPELLRRNALTRRIRIWSAGCSTGEEPYSLAITFKESLPINQGWDVKILATDVDSNVLAKAAAGIYTLTQVNGIAAIRMRRWFQKGHGANAGRVRINNTLQEMVTFLPLNLMQDWPMKGLFDVIFCRNVVIYFDKPTQKILFDRYADVLAEDGHLFIGHSESLFNVSSRFKLIGRTIYRKC